MRAQILKACALTDWNGDRESCWWCNGPMPRELRYWCSAACCWEAKANHIWTVARLEARKRDEDACRRCGEPGTQVHHVEPARGLHEEEACIHHLDNLLLLCKPCHEAVHWEPRAVPCKTENCPETAFDTRGPYAFLCGPCKLIAIGMREQDRANRIRECPHCGDLFPITRADRKYCSSNCGSRHWHTLNAVHVAPRSAT